jgi:hypothetical protein
MPGNQGNITCHFKSVPKKNKQLQLEAQQKLSSQEESATAAAATAAASDGQPESSTQITKPLPTEWSFFLAAEELLDPTPSAPGKQYKPLPCPIQLLVR